MSRWSVITCLPATWITHRYTIIYGNNYGKGPQFKFSKGKVKVSFKLSGSLLPSAQNNPHAKVAHLGEACSEPLHDKSLNIPIMSSVFT